jgi:hypothetical protein
VCQKIKFSFDLNIFLFLLYSEKSELANSIHNYELKLEEEQSKTWVPDEEVANCIKCTASFGWTVRRVRNFFCISLVPLHYSFFSL